MVTEVGVVVSLCFTIVVLFVASRGGRREMALATGVGHPTLPKEAFTTDRQINRIVSSLKRIPVRQQRPDGGGAGGQEELMRSLSFSLFLF
jgi:hypothetical protein